MASVQDMVIASSNQNFRQQAHQKHTRQSDSTGISRVVQAATGSRSPHIILPPESRNIGKQPGSKEKPVVKTKHLKRRIKRWEEASQAFAGEIAGATYRVKFSGDKPNGSKTRLNMLSRTRARLLFAVSSAKQKIADRRSIPNGHLVADTTQTAQLSGESQSAQLLKQGSGFVDARRQRTEECQQARLETRANKIGRRLETADQWINALLINKPSLGSDSPSPISDLSSVMRAPHKRLSENPNRDARERADLAARANRMLDAREAAAIAALSQPASMEDLAIHFGKPATVSRPRGYKVDTKTDDAANFEPMKPGRRAVINPIHAKGRDDSHLRRRLKQASAHADIS